MISSSFVVDASVAVAWFVAGETTAFTEQLFEALRRSGTAFVPAIWPAEVANALLVAERSGRASRSNIAAFAQLLAGVDIRIDPPTLNRAFDQVFSLAESLRLSTYDASYVELALRQSLPLATLDKAMARAAQSVGLSVLS